MRIITLCGSFKFQEEMMLIAEKMTLKGNCVLTPIFTIVKNSEITDEQIKKFKDAHYKRIELSDAILVIDVDNYIGNSSRIVFCIFHYGRQRRI